MLQLIEFVAGFLLASVINLSSASLLGDVSQNEGPLSIPVPYALSPTYLTFLARQERKIYNAMIDYAKALEQRLELVKRYENQKF
jgi:hypothetical protein